MKILITGYRGFIGRNVYAHLQKQHDVIGIDIVDGPEWDLLNCPLPQVDLVIHLAALPGVRASLAEPDRFWVNNVDVSQRIFDYYNRSDTRVIYASSSSAKEWFRNPYATTKKVMEQIAPPKSCGMRFHTVYGVDSRPDMMYRKLLTGNATYTTDHYRDFTHIIDVVSAIQCVIDNGIVGVIDVGTGRSVSVSVLVAAAGYVLPMIEGKNAQHEASITCADPKELKSLGWKPTQDVIQHVRHDCIQSRKFSAGLN